MLETVLRLVVDGLFDAAFGRKTPRSMIGWACLAGGIGCLLLAVVLAVAGRGWIGLAAAIVGSVLILLDR